MRLFRSINQHPTLYEIVTGKSRAGAKEGNKRKRVDMVGLRIVAPEILVAHGAAIGLFLQHGS